MMAFLLGLVQIMATETMFFCILWQRYRLTVMTKVL